MNPRATLSFTLIAIAIMVLVFILTQGRPFVHKVSKVMPENTVIQGAFTTPPDQTSEPIKGYVEPVLDTPYSNQQTNEMGLDIINGQGATPLYDYEIPTDIDGQISPDMTPDTIIENDIPESIIIPVPMDAPNAAPAPDKETKLAPQYEPMHVTGSPKIAIIIDDMGVNRRNSLRVIDFDAPLTLAFLPYAQHLEDITAKAKAQNHELMIHMPMQATTNPVSLGPIAIKGNMDKAEILSNMDKAYASFEGFKGVNNHMGSQVTQDPKIMNWVMQSIKAQNLYFIDSKTIGSSVAADIARENGLPTGERDVFLDHQETLEFVKSALAKAERIAAKKGYAILIGHPKDVTIAGLQSWLPDAQKRGFKIVPVSELVNYPKSKSSRTDKIAHVSKIKPTSGEARALKTVPFTTSYKQKEVIYFEPQRPKKAEIIPAPESQANSEDPNSLEARDEILRKLLGQ